MTLDKKINELNEMFSVFDNPMDKYSQIIELGKNNPGLLNEDKNDKIFWLYISSMGHYNKK